MRFDKSQKRNKVSRKRHVLNTDTQVGSGVTRWSQTIGVLLQAGDPCCMVTGLTAACGAPRALKFDEIFIDKKIIFVLKIRKNTVFLAQGALSL
jgi:hypothetical protein